MEQELVSSFLSAVIKTRKSWNNDKQFQKIVEKMEKGESLKRKEFEKVYSILREQGQYH